MRNKKWIGLLCTAVLTCGMTVNAAPFDAAYYAAQNPDVVAAVGNDAAMLELHYNTFGAAEGRMANAEDAAAKAGRNSVVGIEAFDAAYYAAQNPDVAAIYGDDVLSLYTHYINFGAAEGRAPSAAAAEASAKKTGSSSENPYARFASSSSGHHSKSKSSSSSSSNSSVSTNANSDSVSDNSTGESHVHDFEYAIGEHGFGVHDAICRTCGDTKEESCIVNYTSLSDNEHKKSCKLCGHSVDESHDVTRTSIKEVTCAGAGEVKASCTLCGWEKTEPIPVPEHPEHDWNSTNGECNRCHKTCDHSEVTEGKCDTCGYLVSAETP